MQLVLKNYRSFDEQTIHIPDAETTLFASDSNDDMRSIMVALTGCLAIETGWTREYHDSSDDGYVALRGKTGERRIFLPSGTFGTMEGRGPDASDIAVGEDRPSRYKSDVCRKWIKYVVDNSAKKVDTDTLEYFNAGLHSFSEAAGWSRVHVARDSNIYFAETVYKDLSAGSKSRVDATIQVTTAKIDDSAMMIFANTGALDRDGKNGLLRMLLEAQITAAVGMVLDRDKVPDLKKMGYGASYWVGKTTISKVEAQPVGA